MPATPQPVQAALSLAPLDQSRYSPRILTDSIPITGPFLLGQPKTGGANRMARKHEKRTNCICALKHPWTNSKLF